MSKRPLAALRIGNFKAFGETQTIPIKPITLIFGPNSAGKSSIVHGLVFLEEAHRRNALGETVSYNIGQTSVGGTSVDLGGFRQFVHMHRTETDAEFGLDIDVSSADRDLQSELRGVRKISYDLAIGGVTGPLLPIDFDETHESVSLSSASISTDEIELLRVSFRAFVVGEAPLFRIDRLDFSHAIIRRLIDSCITAEMKSEVFEAQLAASLPDVGVRAYGPFNLAIEYPAFSKYKSSDENVSVFWRHVSGLLKLIFREIVRLVPNAFSYLGPLRALPSRDVSKFGEKDPDSRAAGIDAWSRLTTDPHLLKQVNKALSTVLKTPHTLSIKQFVDPSSAASSLARGIRLGMKESLQLRPRSVALEHLLTESNQLVEDHLNVLLDLDESFVRRAYSWIEPWRRKLIKVSDSDRRQEIIKEAILAIRAKEDAAYLGRHDIDPDIDDGSITIEKPNHFVDDESYEIAARCAHEMECSSEEDTLKRLVLVDRRTNVEVSHRDVGIGVSQVLPVLVRAYGIRHGVIVMEQPEIHLHPKLQAELADVFIESALGDRKNTFLLETHSEHLILRIMRRIRETHIGLDTGLQSITPDDVCILYVEPTEDGSHVRELRVDEEGDLMDRWPGGFFEEAFNEKFKGR